PRPGRADRRRWRSLDAPSPASPRKTQRRRPCPGCIAWSECASIEPSLFGSIDDLMPVGDLAFSHRALACVHRSCPGGAPNDDGLVAAPGETRSPDALDTLTEDELRRFFLHLVRERQASRSTLIVYRSGI